MRAAVVEVPILLDQKLRIILSITLLSSTENASLFFLIYRLKSFNHVKTFVPNKHENDS